MTGPLNDEYITKLQDKIRLEFERREFERQRLEESRRLRVAEQNRLAIIQDVVGRYANLGEQISGLLIYLQQTSQMDDALREWFDELSERIEQIEQVLILLLAERGNGDREAMNQARRQLKRRKRQSLERQLAIQQRNLNNLLEQSAKHGGQSPVILLNNIEQAEEEIDKIETALDELER